MADHGWKALLAEASWLEDGGRQEGIPAVLARLAESARATPHSLRVVLDAVVALERPALLGAFAAALAEMPDGTADLRRAAGRLDEGGRPRDAEAFHDLLTGVGGRAAPADLIAHARCLDASGAPHRIGPLLRRLAEVTAADPSRLRFIVDAVAIGGPRWVAGYASALARHDPGLLVNAAKRLGHGGHWPAKGAVLALLHHQRDAPWKAVAAQAARLRSHGGAAAAEHLMPHLARAALATRFSYKVILEAVATHEDPGGLRVFAGEIAARSRRHYLATARKWVRLGDPRRVAWTLADPPPGADHDAWRQSLAWLAEQEGDPDLADALVGTLREPPVQLALGPEPTPTASTLLFRNRPLLAALVGIVRERLAQQAAVSIHVAAVSSGEEAYSLAASLQEAGLLDRCTLHASDYSPELLARARTGQVERAALRAAGPAMARHFEPGPDGPRLGASLLDRIHFERLDLLEPVDDPSFDLFVANNVLVHYPPALQATIVRHIAMRLAPGGVACLGGQTNEGIRDTLQEAGLVPRAGDMRDIHEGWALQRRAWYQSPRPYWALPPYRPGPGAWRFTSLFTRAG